MKKATYVRKIRLLVLMIIDLTHIRGRKPHRTPCRNLQRLDRKQRECGVEATHAVGPGVVVVGGEPSRWAIVAHVSHGNWWLVQAMWNLPSVFPALGDDVIDDGEWVAICDGVRHW